MVNEKTILIIEDEKPLLEAISKKLRDAGFSILTARNVDQAIGYLRDPDFKKFDAVWLDHYLLGEKTGLDFLGVCRHEGSTRREVPIFVVSNTGGHDKEETYMQLGASKYFVKANHSLKEIIEDIKKALGE